MKETRPPLIGVVGEQDCPAEIAELARQVGGFIAERGAVLVCGGRSGVMEAAARGASERGGLTVGILPGASADEANGYVSVAIATGLGEARNFVIARACRVLIAIGGSFGTLSEIAFALKLGTPVVGLRTWSLSRGDEASAADPIHRATDPLDAVSQAWRLAGLGPDPAR